MSRDTEAESSGSESGLEASVSRCQRCIDKDIECSSLGNSIKKCASCIRYRARCVWNDAERNTVATLPPNSNKANTNAATETGIMTRRRSKAAGENLPSVSGQLSSATLISSRTSKKPAQRRAKQTKAEASTNAVTASAPPTARNARLKRKRVQSIEDATGHSTHASVANDACDSQSLTFDGALALLDMLGFQFPTGSADASRCDPRAKALGLPLPQVSALSEPHILENVHAWTGQWKQSSLGSLSSDKHNFMLQWVTEILQEHDSRENRLCIAVLGLLKTGT